MNQALLTESFVSLFLFYCLASSLLRRSLICSASTRTSDATGDAAPGVVVDSAAEVLAAVVDSVAEGLAAAVVVDSVAEGLQDHGKA